jgi:hypothetical protein
VTQRNVAKIYNILEDVYASFVLNFMVTVSPEELVNFDQNARCHFPKDSRVVPL